ncbi:MAG: DUF4258 domain-containing protein [Candidatus Omnitrophota bacterium]|nr:DUF4258 domain-containing protein [Candidatus Omnitrophota bacterium]
MDREKLSIAIINGRIEWQRHALERMAEREIFRDTVKKVLLSGEIIEDYPHNKPYPSALFLGWIREEPFHVVAAFDSEGTYCFIVTAYRPDLDHFQSDYRTRR